MEEPIEVLQEAVSSPGAEKRMVVAGKKFSGGLIGGPQDTQGGFRLA
jgi:hypothetical protein